MRMTPQPQLTFPAQGRIHLLKAGRRELARRLQSKIAISFVPPRRRARNKPA